VGGHSDFPGDLGVGHASRFWGKLQTGPADNPIEASIAQDEARVFHLGGQEGATPRPLDPSYLEDIGKIGCESQGSGDFHEMVSIIMKPESLVAGTLPEQLGAEHVEGVPEQNHLPIERNIRVGQVYGKEDVVLPQCGAQQQWALAFQAHF
jgi:hypothetical protein